MFTFYKALASNPTLAPTVTGLPDPVDGYRIGYRVKTDSGYTAISPLTTLAYALPITATIPAYADDPPGLAFELIAFSAGSYYSLAVTTANTITLANAPVNSPIAYVTESFAPGTPDPGLGIFSSTVSPSCTFYAKYQGTPVKDVIVDVLKGQAERATELFGQVLVSFLGSVGEAGVLDVSDATSVFWDNGIKSSNVLRFPVNNTGVYKFRLTLTNYAPTGFAVAATNSFRLELYTTPKSYPYPAIADIPTPSLFYSPQAGAYSPFLTVVSEIGTLVPVRVYVYGRMLVTSGSQDFVVPTGSDRIVLSIDGFPRALLPSDVVDASREFLLLTLVSGEWEPACNFVTPVIGHGVTSSAFTNGSVVYLNTTTYTLTSTPTSVILGVAMGNATLGQALTYVAQGIALVRTTAASIAGLGVAIGAQFGSYRLYLIRP